MILTIGPGGSGLTFLSWSIVYLRGDTMYTNLNGNTAEVTVNPVTGCVAENFFNRDHITSTKQLVRLNQATSQSVVYVVPNNQTDFEYILEFPGKHVVFTAGDCSEEFFARMCETVPNNQYVTFINELSTRYRNDIVKQVLLDCNKFFTQYYTVPQSSTIYTISYQDIFKNLDSKIGSLFDFLELSVDSEKFQNWQTIYNNYRQKNQDFLKRFLTQRCEVNSEIKSKIFKEILQWRNGSSHHIN